MTTYTIADALTPEASTVAVPADTPVAGDVLTVTTASPLATEWTAPAEPGLIVPVLAAVAGLTTFTNNLLAATLQTGTRVLLDLDGYTQVRLVTTVVTASVSANTPRIRLMYATTDTITVGNYLDIGTSVVACSLAAPNNTVRDSGWIALAAGAIATSRYVALVTDGGDGAADPQVGPIMAYFR